MDSLPLSPARPAVVHRRARVPSRPSPRLGLDRSGRHTLIAAADRIRKTLAAFLTALDDLFREGLHRPLPDEVRVLYVSPLKALSADIHKNLAEPRRGIRRLAEDAGHTAPVITAAVRTGDTTQSERAAMLRTPPHILVRDAGVAVPAASSERAARCSARPHRDRRRIMR